MLNVYFVLFLDFSIISSIAFNTFSGSGYLLPENTTFTPSSNKNLNSFVNIVINRFISPFTSSSERLKFSVENANTDTYGISNFSICLHNFFNVLAPSLWPKLGARPRFFAHLRLPSIIIATCLGIFFCSILFTYYSL